MKILQIAHPNVPVMGITGGYGGLEEVVVTLDNAYTRLGHQSFVVASSDSELNGTLLPTIKSLYGPGNGHMKANLKHIGEGFQEHSKRALEHIRKIKPDIIHDHTGYHPDRSFSEKLFDVKKGLRTPGEIASEKFPPILNTIHGYPNKENEKMYLGFPKLFAGKNIHFNAVSQFQRAIFRDILEIDFVVLNAVDVDSYIFGEKGKGYVFSMGSIYKGKGTHEAVNTALALDKKLILAGPYFHNVDYWKSEIASKIDRTELRVPTHQLKSLAEEFVESEDKVLYLGELGAAEKRIIYSGADAFYFPVTIDETFGLVSAEANASGVPVVSYLSGGVPEVILHGKTGYTVKKGDQNKFIHAASEVESLSRIDCRKWAKDHFDATRQAKNYLDIYMNLIEK